jgi:hypothetical protein
MISGILPEYSNIRYRFFNSWPAEESKIPHLFDLNNTIPELLVQAKKQETPAPKNSVQFFYGYDIVNIHQQFRHFCISHHFKS